MKTRAIIALLTGVAMTGTACTTPPAPPQSASSAAPSMTATSGSATTSTAAAPAAESHPAAPPTTTENPVPDAPSTDIPIRLTINGTVITAALSDNPSARDLLAQLPLTLTVRDYDRVEKTAALPAPLTLEGAPQGTDPAPFDIGYYAPDQVLVLYYGDVGFFNGIVALGRFDAAAGELIQNLADDSTITIAPD